MNSLDERAVRIAAKKRWARIEFFLGLLFVCAVIAGIVTLSAWLSKRSETVTETEQAGHLLEAIFNDGLTTDSTTVRTSLGTFKVYGTFQTVTGHAAEIRTYQNGARRLCDNGTNVCKTLVE